MTTPPDDRSFRREMATAYRSGIMLLPTTLALLPAAILGGGLLSKFGRYKPILFASFALIVVGFGLFAEVDLALQELDEADLDGHLGP